MKVKNQLQDRSDWLPGKRENHQGKERCVGIELEMAGVSPEGIMRCIQSSVGGDGHVESPVLMYVENTEWGRFKIELDASYIQQLHEDQHESKLIEKALEVLTWATEQIVPWEVVTPPIPVNQMWRLPSLVSEFRKLGALGTRHSLHYAFGVHYNPDLPALTIEVILNYFRAYLCLHEWIVDKDSTDTARKLSTYITHFDNDYIRVVINRAYQPTPEQFTKDYLMYNPTRNRSLDLLPLLTYINESMVREAIDDSRIKARPTFHYRLPNCDIDNIKWNLDQSWSHWLKVEELANDKKMLDKVIAEYERAIIESTQGSDSRWLEHCRTFLDLPLKDSTPP